MMVRPDRWSFASAILLLACFAMATALASGTGCGSKSGSGGAAPTGLLRGNLMVATTLTVPSASRATFQQNQESLEAQGFTVADDGSTVTTSPAPAAGWEITLGTKTTFVDLNGDFLLNVTSADPTQGSVYYPGDDSAVAAVFFTSALVPDGQPTNAMVLEWTSPSLCGMTPAGDLLDAGPGCEPSPSGGSMGQSGPSHAGKPTAVTNGPLGTYPAGNQTQCLQDDGPTKGNALLDSEYYNFVGSTCWDYVTAGCCVGERAALASRTLSYITGSGFNNYKHCVDVHKGRYCQEVLQGDLEVQLPDGTIATGAAPDQFTMISVNFGQTVSLTVHNNGCFGDTYVAGEPLGTVTGAGVQGSKIQHYDSPATEGNYHTDRVVTYTAPSCAAATAAGWTGDAVTFEADGAQVRLIFTNDADGGCGDAGDAGDAADAADATDEGDAADADAGDSGDAADGGGCPKVASFTAAFDQSCFCTTYTVVATDPTGGTLSYVWSDSNTCGMFVGGNSSVATWYHPDSTQPGACPVESVHPGTITAVITGGGGTVTCQYQNGSASGNIAMCVCGS